MALVQIEILVLYGFVNQCPVFIVNKKKHSCHDICKQRVYSYISDGLQGEAVAETDGGRREG